MFAEKYNKIIKEIFTRIMKMAEITMGNIWGLSITVLNESLTSIITLETSLDLSMCPEYARPLVGMKISRKWLSAGFQTWPLMKRAEM